MVLMEEQKDKIAYYHQQAKFYLKQPPNPRLRVLAFAFYEKALQLAPENTATLLLIAKAWHIFGDQKKVLFYCKKVLSIAPNAVHARFLHCILQISMVEDTPEQLEKEWKLYEYYLLDLLEFIKNATPQMLTETAKVLEEVQPKFLPYKGKNVLKLQLIWGKIVDHVTSSVYTTNYKVPSLEQGEKIRIGFVSKNFHLHSDWKMLLRGWMSQINKDNFELYGYYLGEKEDRATIFSAALCKRFVQGKYSINQWQTIINEDKPHVLIYPEIGWCKLTTLLASLRLAPVQCTSWGNPMTSGLRTVDYFLSSELAEPENGDTHYCEKVVRLPFLSTHFKPLEREIIHLSPKDFGLNSNGIIYLCAQPFIKYPAAFDEVFACIAKEVPNSQFVFFNHHFSQSIVNRFKARIKDKFLKYDVDFKKKVVFLERQTPPHYHALARLSSVFLDGFYFSGGTSTMETAIDHGIPMVTLPGQFMRGRQSYAILKGIGITETIATSVDEYVSLAVRLGNDSKWRIQIAEQIKTRKKLVYEDKRCIQGLENFLSLAVKNSIAGKAPRSWPQ